MRRLFTLFTLVAVALVFAAPVEAQFARAAVQGNATDPDGVPLPGVTVLLANNNTGASRTVVTSVTGGYVIQGLTSGDYTITFSLQGFQTVERVGIELHVGETPSIDVQMVLSSLEETVTVTAQTPMVEVTSKQVGASLTSSEIEDLPSINRSFIMFASLLPGVVARQGTGTLSADVIYVNGQDDNNNQFNIDGAANDDDQNGGNAGGQVRAAFEAMAEFQILTSQFDAEFGRTIGGVINAVTKSGTNEFHGVGFYYAQRSDWNTTPFFTERLGIEQPKVSFNGEGFTVGGPIIRNKTHFFVSFEHLAPNRPVVNNFDAIGRPDASFASSEENNVWNWVLKLDHQLSENNKFAARLLWEYQPQANSASCGSCTQTNLTDEEDYDWTFVTSMDTVLNDTMFNNFRWSFTREDLDFTSKPVVTTCDRSTADATFACVAAFEPQLNYDNIIDGQRGNQSRRRNNSIQFDDTLSWYLPDKKGDHDVRTGFHLSAKQVDRDSASNANGSFSFAGDDVFAINDTSTYPERFNIKVGGSTGSVPSQDLPQTYVAGLFIQDDWQPIANFTINLGLRWDWETITEGDYNNIGPRLGFAWDPRGDGRTTIRGGWGRFYGRYIFGEWEDPILDSVFSVEATTLDWNDGDRDQADMIQQMQNSGCQDLACLRNYLRDTLSMDLAAQGFNSAPTVEGSGLGLRDQVYADTLSVGAEHEVVDNISIGVDIVRTEAKNQIVRAVLNDNSLTRGRPQISIFNGVTDMRFRDIDIDMNNSINAETTHTSLLFSLRKRMSSTPIGRLSGRVSYSLSSSSGNVRNGAYASEPYFQRFSRTGWNFDNSTITGDAPTNEILGFDHPKGSSFPVPWARTHNFVVSGSWIIPKTSYRDNGGVVLSGIFRTLTGDRTTFTDSSDAAQLDNSNRGLPEAGDFNPNDPNDISFENIAFDGEINGAQVATSVTMDFSLRYRIPFGSRGWYATLSLDVFNLFDRVNFSNYGSTTISSSSFLVPSRAFPMREIQLGGKFTY